MHENVPKAILTKPWLHNKIRNLVAFLYRSLERLLMLNLPVIYAEKSYAKDYPWVRESKVVMNMPMVGNLLSISETKYPVYTLAYIGGVTPERGSIVTLEAIRILRKQQYIVHWECIGPLGDSHNSDLIQLSQKYDLEGIRIRGYMLPSEGWQIVAKCQVGLAILQPIPNYIESYPTKIFEYMALGLPIIVSDFSLYREVVEDAQCGICVNPENPKEIARAIQWLIENPLEAKKMGQQGQDAVRTHYNWDNESKKLLELYDKLV
jgi:glycosyltransferase involved in cell wall biosynthesis